MTHTKEDMREMFVAGYKASRGRGSPIAEMSAIEEQTAKEIFENYFEGNYE